LAEKRLQLAAEAHDNRRPLMRRKNTRTGKRGADYSIGFGRPPTETRFRPGRSGNPKGRPKGTRNTASMAREALEQKVSVTVGARRRIMTVREAPYRRLAEKAISGDIKALVCLSSLESETHQTESKEVSPHASAERDLEIIQAFLERRRAAKGDQR
jgi:hypothetical protein